VSDSTTKPSWHPECQRLWRLAVLAFVVAGGERGMTMSGLMKGIPMMKHPRMRACLGNLERAGLIVATVTQHPAGGDHCRIYHAAPGVELAADV
jgi:hypothetical protein